ncbi:adaptin region [Ancylostoma ceylanicum]|uniref:Adaptin region n=1 Tax=Ancylostoma ceylanicum TaxID=53326 RepID=A0A0D6LCX9_9BILA|nr:adaptin region [Ancylostoma ceylanicum]
MKVKKHRMPIGWNSARVANLLDTTEAGFAFFTFLLSSSINSRYGRANKLQMLGYDISWAAFNIIEVMASTKYTEKRIGFEQMALRKVRSNLDRLFDKSLTDLIRGIRNNKENEARYIASCIEEIKMELRQDSTYIKANAIEKLAYLQMLGYDISWAAFNIIEVMASTKYTEKRIGYLAAAQCFHDTTEVLMLTTNLIRKDLNSSNMYDSGVALGGLSCFVTPDLARDLASDIVNLLSSSRPYTRKRAVLLLYKIFLKYPEALRPTFPRLKDKLEDPDPGVQSAAVNVICELARKNPKNYLTLAPVFFKLMTTSSNNWMLIKIIKLFGALVPLEPRLGKKLLEPLTNLINSTSAMSLLYECINTVIAVLISISAGGDHAASIQLCVQKLGVLIEDSDQNLKYLGLLAMGKILQTHPKAVQAHKDIVLRCLDDKDESIRLRSLDLLYGMVSKKNIMEIVKKLMEHVESAEGSHYRYISVLVELTKVEGTKHGAKIAEQIQDVTVRVESIRHFSVSQMALLVENAHILLAGSAQQRNNISEVLLAAAWICGEYSQWKLILFNVRHVRNVPSVLESMLRARTSVMSGHILSVYVQNIGKLYSTLLSKAEEEDDWDAIESLDNLMLSKLADFELAEHLEAQERACTLMSILRVVEAAHARREKIATDIAKLYEGELNPVAPKAQRKVPVPDGLDLDEWINEPWQDTPESSEESDIDSTFGQPAPRIRSEFTSFGCVPTYDDEPKIGEKPKKNKKKETVELSPEEIERRRKAREAERESNPYYVKGTAPAPKRPTRFVTMDTAHANDVDKIDIQSPLEIPGVVGLSRYMEQQDSTLTWKKAKEDTKKKKKGKKGKKKRRISTSSEEEVAVVHQVNRADGEMPEGAKSTDDEDSTAKGVSDEFRALDINLDEPLRPDEVNSEVDIDTWLRDEETPAVVENSKPEKKTKKKKKLAVAREAYEETSGVCTPSNPNFDRGISPRMSHCTGPGSTKLCSNSDLSVDFASSLNPGSDEVVVRLGLLITGPRRLKNVEANVVDTLNARMVRSEPGFLLPTPLSPSEHGELRLHFALASKTISQTLRGTITYLAEEEDGSVPGKLDFKVPLRCTDSLLSVMISKNDFSQLLAGGRVDFSASAQFASEHSFRDLLTRITFVGHFSVVEEVGSAASLYATTTSGDPVCVLLKKNQENVHIGCKTGDQKMADTVVEDLKDICTRR